MLLQPCHLLLRFLFFFMLEWMPWTLKSGDLSVTGTIYILADDWLVLAVMSS